MSSKRNPLLWLEDMLTATQENLAFTKDMTFESFIRSIQVVKAVLFNLQLLGEAANKVPEEIQVLAPEIPWQQLRGLRNRIVHEYFDMNLEMVWAITQKQLVPLEKQLKVLIFQIKLQNPL
jgi:uncharacterized protein with HEPN domain